jgi:DNA (cytosine-5)-methyltransferase 1
MVSQETTTNPNTTRCKDRDKQYRGESTQGEQGECGISGHSIGSESNTSTSGEKENRWQNFPTQSPICGGNDGIPRELDSITFSKWRNESIKAYGNAIVPQVAHQIFKTIQQFENSI